MRVPRQHSDDVAREIERLEAAVQQAESDLKALASRSVQQVGKEEAAIFSAQKTMLRDPELQSRVKKTIQKDWVNAEFAWQEGIQYYAAALRATHDSTLAARAADVEDVGRRVLALLMGRPTEAQELKEASIIVADDLAPADTVAFDRSRVLGFCTQGGGPTAHAAILAKALGVPCVVGLSAELGAVQNDSFLILNGDTGEVIIEPDGDTVSMFAALAAEQLDRQREAIRAAERPAVTRDGHHVEVVANVGSVTDAAEAVKNGAEGIGLLRTEFLFLERPTPPSEAEQVQAYSRIFETIGGSRPLVVRTLDIGGDKPARYLEMPKESNPFLGVRGIRLSLRYPEVFEGQLRALLIAGCGYDLRIMFPMVASVEEVEAAREAVERCQAALRAEGRAHCEKPQVGIMVEVPSAAVMARAFTPLVDFFSLGTNDLSQYTLAAERTSPDLARLADALHPAVLNLIRQVIEAAHERGKWVGVCGELAGEVLATPILLGLGLDEFSASPSLIPRLKQTIGRFAMEEARAIATKALTMSNAKAVREYMKGVLEEAGARR
jgi:phosphoenolpyruvate-protein phosphotransferase